VKILLLHGFLLRGTGSNVYNAQLARALRGLGHEVHVVCQERRPGELGFVDAVDGSGAAAGPGTCTVWRPDIGSVLPVYVQDTYEGFEARTFADLDDAAIEAYVERNVAFLRDLVPRVRPDVTLANHLVMQPLIAARAGADPYAVKVHGSALEYTVKPQPERFLPAAREGLARARAVLVGSRHTAESLWAAVGDDGLPARTRLGPPGVDVASFVPGDASRLPRLVSRLRELPDEGHGSFARSPAASAQALARLEPGRDRLVAYVGKLIVSKGVDLLAAAWPLVLTQVPTATLVVVGFGAYREGFERLVRAFAEGDRDAAMAVAREGRVVEGGPPGPLRHLSTFLESAGEAYFTAARGLRERVVVAGRLEHHELVDLLPACEAQVVPSTFPEAFGMVAAEAAACGVLPVVAGHSGLLEVAAQLAPAVGEPVAGWLAYPPEDDPVRGLAARVTAWLEADEAVRAPAREALVRTANERFSWEGVANGVIAAAQGDLAALPPP
jgi:glycosyltransferase involved in cell wall biosynthesis